MRKYGHRAIGAISHFNLAQPSLTSSSSVSSAFILTLLWYCHKNNLTDKHKINHTQNTTKKTFKQELSRYLSTRSGNILF
jgi:hypothetical protein